MADPTPTVSVVVPTHNRGARLEQTVRPLLADPGATEVVVAVDGSTDDTMALLERMAREDQRLRPLALRHGGAAHARRLGVEAATGEIVLILDDDVLASPGLAAGHAAHHASAPGLVVVGYMPVAERRRERGGFPAAIYKRDYERTVTAWEDEPRLILRSLWLGNLSMRREDYLTVSAQELVVGYHEDTELGLRCVEAGFIGRFDRSLAATHLYERDPAGFLRDAHSSGRNLPEVLGRHPATAEPLSPAFPAEDLPGPLRPLVHAGAALAPLRSVITFAVAIAGRVRLWTLERHGGSLLWRIEQLRAVQGR